MKDILLHCAGALGIQIGLAIILWMLGVEPRIGLSVGGFIGAGVFIAREAIQMDYKRQGLFKTSEALPPIGPCALLAVAAWVAL